MAIIKADDWRPVETEEERRKRLGLSLPKVDAWQGVQGNVPKPAADIGVGAKAAISVRDTSHDAIKEFARSQPPESAGPKSALTEYFKMAHVQGAEAVNQRIIAATSIWRRYYKPYDGASIVWNMVKSPYTVPELEKLAAYGQSVLFNYNASNKQNYIPAAADDGTKDGRLLFAGLQFFQPTKAQLGIGAAAAPGNTYENKPYGYGVVMPSELLPSNENYIKGSPEYASAMAMQANYEKWGDEFQAKEPAAVADLEKLTGIARSSVRTWQEWEGLLKEWRDAQKFAKADQFDATFNTFADKRTKFLAETHGDVLKARGMEVGIGMLQAGITAIGLYATGAGLGAWGALGAFGKVATLGGVGIYGSQTAAAQYDPQERIDKAAEEARAVFEGQVKTVAQRQYDDVMATVSKLETNGDRASIKTIQEELQKPVLAEDGTVVRVPLGVGLVPDGLLSAEWKGVIEQAADMQVREAADLQQSLIQGGYAPKDLEITGAFEKWDDASLSYVPDEDWQKALTRAQGDWAAQQKMAEGNPLFYAFIKASGLPMSWAGVKALGTRLTNEGKLYAPLKALAQSGYYIGGMYNAIPAVIEVKEKLDKDPARKRLQEDLVAAVNANLPAVTPDVPFDVTAESMTPGKALYLVENGNVTDPTAQRIASDLNKNEMLTLSEPTSGWVGVFGYMGGDYEGTHQWLADNYNTVHALNMAIDILGQMVITHGVRVVGRGVSRIPEAFSVSNRANKSLGRIVKYADAGDAGNVVAVVGGTDARLYATKLAHYRYGRDVYKPDAPVVQAKATEIVNAAKLGSRDAILRQLGDYAKTPEGVKYADGLIKKAARESTKGKPLEVVVANNLVARQYGKGDVWGMRSVKAYAGQLAADMWGGTDGTYYDIFPQLMGQKIKGKSWTRISMERGIAGIQNNTVRETASAIVLPFSRAPVHSYSYELADFPHRVADFVGAVTNDVSLVNRWRTKATLTDFSKPRAAQRFEAELQALRAEYLQGSTRGKMTLAQKFDSELRGPSTETGVDQLTGLKLAGPAGKEAQFVGRYTEAEQQRETIMQTSQQKTEIALGRDVMLANVKVKDGGSALGYGLNLARGVERSLQGISTPLRVISVGAGSPVLFQKHAFADTGRTIVSEGAGALRLSHNRKGFEQNVNQLSPAAADRVLFEKKVAIENEQHYNLEGGLEVTRQARKAFNDRGRPVNMSAAIDTVRRTIMDEGFRQFAKGGEAGLRIWLESADGQKFLAGSGAVRQTRAGLKELREKYDGQTLKEIAVSNYLAEKLELFADYAQLPRLNKAMMAMADGTAPRHDSDIRKAMVDAYDRGKENPTVDVPIETGNKGINLFAKATKLAMTPNRLNREAVFTQVFNKVYGDLTKKQGVPADDAGVIASTVARTRTGQVHFDLSEGMRFEMKHRWFAWFGTKHRLWNTWLATAALKYPGYAAALNEYAKWMEQRNADESIPEWEKNNIVVTVGGKRLSINLAPYAWLMDYAIESPFGNLAENGVMTTINKLAGTDLKPAPDAFGFSLTRFDPMVKSVWRWFHAPGGDDKGEWLKFINDLPEKEREKFSEQVTTVWALSNGEKTIEEAAKEVMVGNVKHEAYRFFKPASSKLYSEDQVALFEAKKRYEALVGTPQASDFLKANPEFAMTIGAGSRDPYAQAELNSALSVYTNIKDTYQKKVVEAWRNGQLEDTNFAANLYAQEQAEIDKLKRDSPAFTSWMGSTGEDSQTFAQTAHFAFPSVTAEQWEEARIPTTDEQSIYHQQLEQNFEDQCKAYGLNPSSASAVVRMLRHQTIEMPMAEFTKSLPSDLAAGVKNNARMLALSDYAGLFRSSMYVETMTNAKKRDMWLAGTKYAKADANNLLMMMLTPAEKTYLGWKTDDQASQLWFQYGLRRAQAEDYAGAMGWSTSSTNYKKLMAGIEAEVESTWLPQSEAFAQEWNLSHMRLDERMQLLGYGRGKDPASLGWADFFDIVGGYWATLANTYNKSTKKLGVSPMAQAAAEVNHAYLKELVALSKRNKDWYDEWKYLGLSPSKVGFYSHWRLTDNSDWELWAKDEPVDETEMQNIYGEE